MSLFLFFLFLLTPLLSFPISVDFLCLYYMDPALLPFLFGFTFHGTQNSKNKKEEKVHNPAKRKFF